MFQLNRITLWQLLIYAILAIILCLLPMLLGKSYINLAVEILILALAGLSLNFIFGNADMVNFGHAGPYALGAYATALLAIKAGAPFWLAFIAGPLLAGLISFFFGLITVKLVDLYFAFLTVAFCLLIWTVAYTWYGLTGGDDGLSPIRVPDVLFSVENYYYFTLIVVVLCTIVLKILTDSAFGRILKSIRENTNRTEFIGIDVIKYKLIAFVISGFFAGMAGALYAGFSHAAVPNLAGLAKSSIFMLVCLMGGMYTFYGPIVGAFVYLGLYKLITTYTPHWEFFFGSIMVLLVLFFRGGIVGFIEERYTLREKDASV